MRQRKNSVENLWLVFLCLCLVFNIWKESTVYIGFCDQPPSQGSRSLKPMEVAKLSGFQLGIVTRRSLKVIFAVVQTLSSGYNDLDGHYLGRHLWIDRGPSRHYPSLNSVLADKPLVTKPNVDCNEGFEGLACELLSLGADKLT